MEQTKRSVRQIAQIASVDIQEEKRKQIERDFETLTALADLLPPIDETQSADTDVPTLHDRADAAYPGIPQRELMQNAPLTQDGCFVLPRILGDER